MGLISPLLGVNDVAYVQVLLTHEKRSQFVSLFSILVIPGWLPVVHPGTPDQCRRSPVHVFEFVQCSETGL